MNWFKEKLLGKLVDKATINVPDRTIWLIVAILALAIWLFTVEEFDDEEPEAPSVGGAPEAGAKT